jgi:hypothetical protein
MLSQVSCYCDEEGLGPFYYFGLKAKDGLYDSDCGVSTSSLSTCKANLIQPSPGGACEAGKCKNQCGLFTVIDGTTSRLTGDCACPSGTHQVVRNTYDQKLNTLIEWTCECDDSGKTLMATDGTFKCFPSCPTGSILGFTNKPGELKTNAACFCDASLNYWGPDEVCDVSYSCVPSNHLLIYGGTCKKCPDGCQAYSLGGGCNCGDDAVHLEYSNTRYQCPSDRENRKYNYAGSSYTVDDLCQCKAFAISTPTGNKCSACTGPLQVQDAPKRRACSCPSGLTMSSDYSRCECPVKNGVPQGYNATSGTCNVCQGRSTVSAAGTCDCVAGAIKVNGVCDCDKVNGFGRNTDSVSCDKCGTGQIVNANGYCVCDTTNNFTPTSASGQPLQCRACPANSKPREGSCECKGNAYFNTKTFQCVACGQGSSAIGEACSAVCNGRNAQSAGTICQCIPGYTPDKPGDTSSSLTCSGCSNGQVKNYRSQQCAPCPLQNGRVVTAGICTCDLAHGYGVAVNGGGQIFACQLCPSDSTPSMQTTTGHNGLLPGCTCNDKTKELLVTSTGYTCGIYVPPTCDDPRQMYVPGIRKCAGPCPDNSALDSSGKCRCKAGYSAADPSKTTDATLQCQKCGPDQFAPTDFTGCFCTATYKLGACPILPSGGGSGSNGNSRRDRFTETRCGPERQYCPISNPSHGTPAYKVSSTHTHVPCSADVAVH